MTVPNWVPNWLGLVSLMVASFGFLTTARGVVGFAVQMERRAWPAAPIRLRLAGCANLLHGLDSLADKPKHQAWHHLPGCKSLPKDAQ